MLVGGTGQPRPVAARGSRETNSGSTAHILGDGLRGRGGLVPSSICSFSRSTLLVKVSAATSTSGASAGAAPPSGAGTRSCWRRDRARTHPPRPLRSPGKPFLTRNESVGMRASMARRSADWCVWHSGVRLVVQVSAPCSSSRVLNRRTSTGILGAASVGRFAEIVLPEVDDQELGLCRPSGRRSNRRRLPGCACRGRSSATA